ncbi:MULTISPECIES: YdeI family protein [Emticicia]|uniref:YdeI/OmpD-associated family protein n=1 Tax=Emticicia TaxID=312278 RepID=UPI0007D8C706|nr:MULTISPECIES: YdeI/OmpD-associated family protein [Emticicia]
MENEDFKSIYLENRNAWRSWLIENHASEKNIWIKIYKKQSQTPSVYYDEAVDEALCFGWVDSSIKKGNDEFYYQFFAKRNPKSNWSRINKAKVEKLLSEGLMAEAGLKMVEIAKEIGTWTALDDVENLISPSDLQEKLDQNPTAKGYFEAFPRSVKRGILEWLLNAKQAETRQKRIEEIVSLAEKNERANQYKPKV